MKDHQQQQTYVTKHDLALLHKKIIATDLIVQKYQEANKALLALQVENDELKRQIEQITNECCIFGKQVTECTQECDMLKEQIQMLNVEKRELHRRLQLMQDENTGYHHELMVMKQYQSLKDINDQLSKDNDRQNKEIAKLHLKLQRKTAITYRPSKDKSEPSETDIALINSQKSVRELKLALGRFVNFVQASKIEIPTSLHIRPILKAHDINDDFMEAEGEFVLKSTTPVHVPIITSTIALPDNDDEDDDDNGDFIDVIPSLPLPPPPVAASAPALVDIAELLPASSSKYSLRKQKKSKEILPPVKVNKKKSTGRRRKNVPISESEDNPLAKLDDMANELEMALAKSDTPKKAIFVSQPTVSFLSDDEELQESDKQTTPPQIYRQPLSPLFSPEPEVNESIPVDMPQWSPPRPVLDEERSEPVGSEIDTDPIPPPPPVQSISFLSDDDEQQRAEVTPSIPIDTLDSNRIDIVHRLLHFLTQMPSFCSPLKPLSLSRHCRSRTIETATSTVHEETNVPTPMEELSTPVEANIVDEPPVLKPTSVIESPLSEPTGVIEETLVIEPPVSKPTRTIEEKSVIELPLLQPTGIIEETPAIEPTLSEPTSVIEKTPAIELPLSEPTDVIEETPVIDPPLSEPTSVIEETPAIDPPPLFEPISNIEETPVIESPSIVIEQPQESLVVVAPIQIQKSISIVDEEIPKSPDPIPELPEQPSLKLSHISIVSRLLALLTRLPVIPLVLPMPLPSKTKKKSPIVPISPPPILRRQSSRRVPLPPSPPPRSRLQTRSLSNIRACISRCNLPISKKRIATDSISPPAVKRLKSTTAVSISPKIENNDAGLLDAFLNSNPSRFPVTLNAELKRCIDRIVQLTEVSVFITHLHNALFAKSESISVLVTRLHPCEECIKAVLLYVNSNPSSAISFQRQFFVQLNAIFAREVKEQKPGSNNRVKLLNRLFFLACSILSSSSSLFVYARLFDIAYGLSRDVLIDALTLLSHVYPVLISTGAQISSSAVLLHRTLDLLRQSSNLSLVVIENLLLSYQTHQNDTDLIRSFVLICRHQSWFWCAQELCSRLLLPLVLRINQRRLCFLIIFQYILILFKDNIDFKRDVIFHDQLKQTFESIETTVNSDEFIVQQKVLAILKNCSSS